MTNTLDNTDHETATPANQPGTVRSPGPTRGPNRHTTELVDRPEVVEPTTIRWKSLPFDGVGLGMIAATYVAMTALMITIGTAVVEWWDTSALGDADADINRWLEEHRTGWLTTVSEHMSMISDTNNKILYGVVAAPLMLWLFRRWHEWMIIFGGLFLELAIFMSTQAVVGRERPPVEMLEQSHTSSFPSGHIAAATTFFVGLGVVILMRTRRTAPRITAWVLMIAGPLAVAWGRIYMGMHYVTDAVAGITIGVVVVTVMYRVVMRTLPPDESADRHDALVAAARGES
jgi:membrane-associated phospholipid phosphatase